MNKNTSTIIPFIAGDGIGPEIMAVTQQIVDAALEIAYGENRSITWLECPAGNAPLKPAANIFR